MKGLIIKDLMNLKRQARILIIFVAFYVILAMTTKNSSVFGIVVAVICAILPVTALSFDERAKWDKYALSMPVSRRDIVMGKYMLGLLLTGAALIINLIFNLLLEHGTPLGEILLTCVEYSAAGIIILSLILPFMFLFGVEKGRLIMMLILFVPAGLIILLSTLNVPMPGKDALSLLLWIVPFAAIVLFCASLMISLKAFKRKEL